jgi:hypothetical protein
LKNHKVPFQTVNVDELTEHPPFLENRGVPQIHLVRQNTPPEHGESLFSQLGNFSIEQTGPVLDGFHEAVTAAKNAQPQARRRALRQKKAIQLNSH